MKQGLNRFFESDFLCYSVAFAQEETVAEKTSLFTNPLLPNVEPKIVQRGENGLNYLDCIRDNNNSVSITYTKIVEIDQTGQVLFLRPGSQIVMKKRINSVTLILLSKDLEDIELYFLCVSDGETLHKIEQFNTNTTTPTNEQSSIQKDSINLACPMPEFGDRPLDWFEYDGQNLTLLLAIDPMGKPHYRENGAEFLTDELDHADLVLEPSTNMANDRYFFCFNGFGFGYLFHVNIDSRATYDTFQQTNTTDDPFEQISTDAYVEQTNTTDDTFEQISTTEQPLATDDTFQQTNITDDPSEQISTDDYVEQTNTTIEQESTSEQPLTTDDTFAQTASTEQPSTWTGEKSSFNKYRQIMIEIAFHTLKYVGIALIIIGVNSILIYALVEVYRRHKLKME
ncbi:hypothetical protein Ciccas_002322 [Cichlidogyrus casuarinus]|uniref:Uncharacterized protein n=1 Tax=Cichlidogyrus casuarinus TaxID=1844966 RepID=A0ABD2QHK0_9PLAT